MGDRSGRQGVLMDGKEEDLFNFKQWLLLDRRVSQVDAANIAVWS
jgi:hypothetical protein